jgi:protein ImuA
MTARIDLAQLKQRIAAIPAAHMCAQETDRLLSLGVPEIDATLQAAGVHAGAVHEIAGQGSDEEQGAAGAAFMALGLRTAAGGGWTAWVTQDADLYAPGLAALGLDLRRLMLVSARRDAEVCWALEEALRSNSLRAVVGEISAVSLTATRRLQLAAEQAGIPCFLLRRWRTQALAQRYRAQPIAAATRWRIASVPDAAKEIMPELGRMSRRVDLWRCRNGQPASWIMEMGHDDDQQRIAALSVAVADPLVDRSIPAAAAQDEPLQHGQIIQHVRFGAGDAAGAGGAERQPPGDPGRRSARS